MSTTTTITLAAAGFLFLTSIKFIAGAIGEEMMKNLDLTADIELAIAVVATPLVMWATGMSYSEAQIGTAAAFFISTAWSAIAVFRTKTLLQMTHGIR